jgi:predicted RNase H-like HicB family nuclease
MHHYGVRIFWWEEDNAWIAVCPAFPYASAFGATREEAARQMDEAIAEIIFTYEQEGRPLPPVEREPTASGQLRLRLPRDVHERAIEQARLEEVSLNTFLVGAISEKLGSQAGLAAMRALRDEIVGLVDKQLNANLR